MDYFKKTTLQIDHLIPSVRSSSLSEGGNLLRDVPARLVLCVFLPVFLLSSCRSKNQGNPVIVNPPYYVDSNYSAVWLDLNDTSIDTVHQIADFEFVNQDSNTVNQNTFKGKIYVANFFFSICPGVCPKMTNNLHRIQDEFEANDGVLIASHSVMPWVDSVARLKEYAELNNIESEKWHLLTGDKEKIYEIARNSYFADEGFGKAITEANDFLHTESIVLIDQNRHIRGIYNGTLPLDMTRLIEDIYLLIENL